jgi:hypothetical protein
MSMAHAQAIAEIDGATGQMLRLFGAGGYSVSSGSRPLYMQHDVHWTPRGTLIMSNSDPDTRVTGAVEYAIDDDSRELVQVREIGFDAGLQAFALGQVIELQNGNVLMNWGGGGVLQEITPEGDVVWEVMTGSGTWFGQVRMFTDFYTGE